MAARPVQVSINVDLLKRIDADPETRKRGRSAFLRSASLLYLEAKRQREIDVEIRRAYSSSAEEMLEDVKQLMGSQVWPRR